MLVPAEMLGGLAYNRRSTRTRALRSVMIETKRGKCVAEKNFRVSLPQEVVGGFGWNESEVLSRVREALVMELLRLDKLWESQAATILGLTRWELLELMGRYDVPAVRMSTFRNWIESSTTEVKRNRIT